MRGKRYFGLMILAATLMLTGCQMVEAPYELSEEEEKLIVNYSAHVVSKFNVYQKDGLTYTKDSEEETLQETETVAENTEALPEQSVGTNNNQTDGTSTAVANTLENLYEATGLKVSYAGVEITDSYMASDVYAVKPDYGKTLLVMSFDVENPTEEDIVVDNIELGHVYSLIGTLDSGKKYHAPSVLTLLDNEWCTFEGTIEAGTTADMVMIFEIPAETTQIDNLILNIKGKDTNFEINL